MAMKRRRAATLAVVCVTSALAGIAFAQAPSGPRALSERYYESKEFDIPVRDGVKLHTQILRPRAQSAPLPFFMVRTPYGLSSEGMDEPARWQRLAESGYLFVIQEMRGTGDSGGRFVLNPPRTREKGRKAVDEATDTYDTVEWLLKNVKGHSGAVGVAGCSYPGYSAVMAGLSGHPAIKAVSPQAAMADMFRGDDFNWNGIPLLAQAPFFATSMDTRMKTEARVDRSDAYEWYLEAGALKDVQPAAFLEPSPTWEEMMRNGALTPFWRSRVLADEAANVRVPTLHVMGWYDGEDFPGPVRLFMAMDAIDTQRTNRLMVGPWNHCMWNGAPPGDRIGPVNLGSATADAQKRIEARFFAHYLKGEGSLEDLPQVIAFETGGGGWRAFDRWPAAGGGAREYFLGAGQRLEPVLPSAADEDRYVSDPAKPVPYARRPIDFFTGDRLVTGDGKARALFLLEDQRFVHDRPDVLTWMSPPLEEDVVLSGQPVVEFFAETTGTDVDWIVQLVDVHPHDFDPVLSGYRLPVTRGAQRASLREDLSTPRAVTPGAVVSYEVALEPRQHRFRKGHRILLQLQSTFFPYLARNPQQLIAPEKATVGDFRVVTNTIHHGGATPSRLRIPLDTSQPVPVSP
jgi:putative CocE/NonD family hydrolase